MKRLVLLRLLYALGTILIISTPAFSQSPQPYFNSISVPSSITLGQEANITLSVTNTGSASSDDGGISLSFPVFTGPGDDQYVRLISGGGDTPGYLERPRGSTIYNRFCQQITAQYLLVEYADNNWTTGETNTITIGVTPQQTGTFVVYIRSAMHQTGTTCTYINAPSTSSYTDQQGWPVYRYEITVNPPPCLTCPSYDFPITPIGSWRTHSSSHVTNGCRMYRVSVTSGNSYTFKTGCGDGATANYDTYLELYNSGCTLVAQNDDGCENNRSIITWTATYTGYAYLKVRGYSGAGGNYTLAYSSEVPAPQPYFNSISVPSSITLGQEASITLSVTNTGSASSDDGGISLSFPVFTGPGDDQYVRLISGGGDTPGYLERPRGSTIYNRFCQQITAQYLLVEYADNNWTTGETNTITIGVTPQQTGTFVVYIRSAMHQTGTTCTYINAPSTSSYTDQQGWPVYRYEITVRPPIPTVTVTSPNGGENWHVGSNYNITATSTGSITGVEIHYSTNSGSSWNYITGYPTTNNSISYNWTVPNTPSPTCRVRVTVLYTGGSVSDNSNANFWISDRIDIMVVYTPSARAWADSFAGNINLAIAQAITMGQTAINNSNVNIGLNLVHSAQVSYTESGDPETDLIRLTNPSDGYMDIIHQWRGTYNADLVALYVRTMQTYAGIAWILNTPSGDPSSGFSVTLVSAYNSYTFVHELGHNMGNHHSRNQISNPAPPLGGLFVYSTGWRWVGTNLNTYCSVMTYSEGSLLVPIFSNPDILWEGTPTGSYDPGNQYAPADNARSMREIKSVIAAYSTITSVPNRTIEVPLAYTLHQNYPNPFNATTTIKFAIPTSGFVSLRVYNLLGQEVAVLVNEERTPGDYSVRWDPAEITSGVYFCRMQSGDFVETKKLVLLR